MHCNAYFIRYTQSRDDTSGHEQEMESENKCTSDDCVVLKLMMPLVVMMISIWYRRELLRYVQTVARRVLTIRATNAKQ